MSGAALVPAPDAAMSVAAARRILKHPVFGDERCIQARDTLILAERVRQARSRVRTSLDEDLPRIESMTAAQLTTELVLWIAAGYYYDDEEP